MAPSTGWQVALLRGVNVGPGKRVPMAALKGCAVTLGFTDAATLLNSGNLVYRTRVAPATAATRLRKAIQDATGVDTPVLVRTRDALAKVLADNPLMAEAEEQPSRFLVTIWDDDTTPRDMQPFLEQPVTVEQFEVGRDAMYCYLPDGIANSVAYEKASRKLKDRITARNWATMQKLLALMGTK